MVNFVRMDSGEVQSFDVSKIEVAIMKATNMSSSDKDIAKGLAQKVVELLNNLNKRTVSSEKVEVFIEKVLKESGYKRIQKSSNKGSEINLESFTGFCNLHLFRR